MSTAESTKDSQTPAQEVLDRAAESFPAHLMPRLVGVEHLRNMLGAARKRVDDSHKLQMFKLKETIGYEPNEEAPAEEEDMGGISVAGDTHITISAPPEQKPMQVVTKAKSLLPGALVAAALLGGGSGIGYIVNDLLKPQPAAPPAANDTDTDTITEFDFPKE